MKLLFFRSVPVFLFLCLASLTLLLTFEHASKSLDQFYAGPYAPSERLLASNDDNLDNYNNPSDTYSPTMQVKYGHQLTNKDFEATQSYLTRALYSPIVIFGLGFIAIILYLCGLLWRCCCECCRCLPDADDAQYDYKRTTNTAFFYLFVFFVLIFDQMVFIGNTNLDQGLNTLDGALGDIYTLTSSVSSNAQDLVNIGALLQADYDSLRAYTISNCPSYLPLLDDAGDNVTEFRSQVTSLNKAIKDLPDKVEVVQDNLDEYTGLYREVGIYVIWALAIVCAILFFIAKVVESMTLMKVTMSLGILTYILYLVLGVPWVLITSVGGDFCMAPTLNIVKAAPKGDLRNTLRYYTSCIGNSTVNEYIDKGSSGVLSFNATLNLFRNSSSSCGSAPQVTDLFIDVRNVNKTITEVKDILDCPNIRTIYFNIVNKGFCEEMYTGIFYIWGSQLVTSFCLFVLLIISSISYQYFDIARIAPMNDDDDEAEDDDHRPKLQLVDLAEENGYNDNNHHGNHKHNNNHHNHEPLPTEEYVQEHHNAQAYSSVGHFDNGLSPRS